MSRSIALLRVGIAALYSGACGLLALLAIGAMFGFAVPALDLLNHGQPVLFYGALGLMLLTPLFVTTPRLRAFTLALTATGFVVSSLVYVPEVVSGFKQRAAMPEDGRPVYTMMTFNVFARNETPQAIVDEIFSVDPDIVALQEYNSGVRDAIHRRLTERYAHFQYCAGGERAFVGLYSKLPFQPLNEDACSSSIMTPNRTARIVVRFAPEGAAPFSLATTHHDWPTPILRQSSQFDQLRDALATVEPPLILAGDFNSTAWSYALREFVAAAGLERHTYNIATFPTLWYYLSDWRPAWPILPIDHVMTRGGIAIHSLTTGHSSGSDHLPVIVRFSVDPPRAAQRSAETPNAL